MAPALTEDGRPFASLALYEGPSPAAARPPFPRAPRDVILCDVLARIPHRSLVIPIRSKARRGSRMTSGVPS